uniref:Manganese-dependent ADP-ribose/CDP-alcohol diphosphatase n=1 Tax=Mola mola TaxID=94237 RepID=A0A3Q3X8I3_MOLML
MQTPLFTFGVIADIQYADIDDGYNYQRTQRRYYRSSLRLLRNALENWSEAAVKPGFILQLGDIIDGFNSRHGASEQALDTVLREFSPISAEVHHVWGNHELYNFSRSWLLRSKLNSAPFPGHIFVLLDAYDVSVLGRDESTEQHREAMTLLRHYNTNENLNSPPYGEGLRERFTMFNGGFGKDQLAWLDSLLSSADKKQERVTIVCHLPVHPKSAETTCLAWNFDKVLAMIRSHSCVVCFLAGHEHKGGYHLDTDTGVHHLTLEAVIETPPDSNAFGMVFVYDDRMELKGSGRMPDRVLLFPGCQSDADQRAE